MLGFSFFLLLFIFFPINCYEVYGRYSGQKTEELRRGCSIKLKPCTPHEGSRIDGTCNNYKRPTRGSVKGPYLRLLKPEYGHRGIIRQNKDHEPLPSARKVRTNIWSDGRVTDPKITRAAVHYLEFIHNDISMMRGDVDYLLNRTYCCEEEGLSDRRCEPITVPYDDPYLRATGIDCMNFLRAETFQDLGCISKEIDPGQVNYQTPLLDLSTIYGVDEEALKEIRRFEKGLLRESFRKGRYVPLNETRNFCFQNNGTSKVCYKFGNPETGNTDLTTTTLAIFFYREHNRIARILHDLNPCWKDDRLFKVARQINIATASNIFMYELLPILLGHKNMLTFHLISERVEFVGSYDEQTDPLVFAEYEIARRYFLTLWDGRIKKYNQNYRYVGEFSLSETLYKQELLEEDTNFEDLNRGTFFQRAAKADDIVDPEISEQFYPDSIKVHDQLATAIQRGRDLGIRGYNSYRRVCAQKEAKTFEDLLDNISAERVEILKKLYKDLEDVDLLVGIMSEDLIPGLMVGPTLFCIMAKQLQVFRFSDRFWFERGNLVHSFTLPQLQEIRKTNMARIACDNAEGIKYIQPFAFLAHGNGNEHIPCTHITPIDLIKWKDDSCEKPYREEEVRSQKPAEIFQFYGGERFLKDPVKPSIVFPKIQTKTPEVVHLYGYNPLLNRYPGFNAFTKGFPKTYEFGRI